MSIKPVPLPPADAPAPFSLPVAAAIKALASGNADERQQLLAYDWILKAASGIGLQSYRSGDSYATAFMEGRRFVASQLIALQAISLDELKKRTTQNG
jgi:hypothetical protein